MHAIARIDVMSGSAPEAETGAGVGLRWGAFDAGRRLAAIVGNIPLWSGHTLMSHIYCVAQKQEGCVWSREAEQKSVTRPQTSRAISRAP